MNFHQRSKGGSDCLLALFVALLIVVAFILQTRTAEAQGNNQQPGTPPAQQPAPQQQGKVVSPFPLIEEAEIKEFDALPKEEQKARLEATGPLFPQKYSMSNLSMREFVKGNWPFVIDYALQPNSTALVTISAEGVEPFDVVLTEPGAPRNEGLSSWLWRIFQPGSTPEQTAEARLKTIIEAFLNRPEKARKHLIVELPASFGESPQVGKLSIQAFTNGPGERKPAYFHLYGIGMGDGVVGDRAGINHPGTAMSSHSHSYGFDMENECAMPIAFTLTPEWIITGLGQKVSYTILSESGFYKVAAVFNRSWRVAGVRLNERVYYRDHNRLTSDRRLLGEWNGKNGRTTSSGWHDLEVRTWAGPGEVRRGQWASCKSDPRGVSVD